MWWLNGSAPDYWGRGPGFESGISHDDSNALQDYCVKLQTISGQRGQPTLEAKTDLQRSKQAGELYSDPDYLQNMNSSFPTTVNDPDYYGS